MSDHEQDRAPEPQESGPDGFAAQDSAPQDPAAEEPSPQEPAQPARAPRDPAPQGPAPRDPAPQDPALQDPAQQIPAQPAPAPQPAAPQWIPVAPQHPYAAPAQQPATGRALALAAMAVGLVALLTAVVSALYFRPAAGIGAALGLAAAVLGVIALVKRQRPLPASISGLVAAALAILVALASGMFALGAALMPSLPAADPETDGPGTNETTPPDSGSAIEWPANMANGGIVFELAETDGIEPVRSDPLEPGTAPQPTQVQRDGSQNDVLIYVDYRCPFCMQFEEQNSELLGSAVSEGNTTVQVVPLTFLDRASAGSYYSSRAAGAVACLADQQPEAAWPAHVALLSAELQPEEGIAGPTNEELIASLDRATGGLSAAAKECITGERFVPFASALNDWVFANPIPNAENAGMRVSSTPTVLVNGVPYPGDPADGEAFRAFFEAQTK